MLTFRRIAPGHYVADDETKRYALTGGKSWTLDVYELTTTAGVRHIVGQPVHATSGGHDRKYLVAAIARAYSELGDDYRPHEHGYAERMTTAIIRAYDETE